MKASPTCTKSLFVLVHSNVHTVWIDVVTAADRSSSVPWGSDWITMSPFTAVQIGIHCTLQFLAARMSVPPVKQAVLFLAWLLVLACLLLCVSMEAASCFERGCCIWQISCSISSLGVLASFGRLLSRLANFLSVVLSRVAVGLRSMRPVTTDPLSESVRPAALEAGEIWAVYGSCMIVVRDFFFFACGASFSLRGRFWSCTRVVGGEAVAEGSTLSWLKDSRVVLWMPAIVSPGGFFVSLVPPPRTLCGGCFLLRVE